MLIRRLRHLFILVLAALLPATVHAAASASIQSVDVKEEGGGYVATLVMFAPVPVDVAWAVLTDFDHMASWVPNVHESKIVANESTNIMTIEQKGTAKFGIASFPYVSVRQMTLDPQHTVRATQVKGSMKRLESLMTLTPDNNGTKLNYRLEMVPSALASAVISKDLLARELSDQFTAIMQEMTRRTR